MKVLSCLRSQSKSGSIKNKRLRLTIVRSIQEGLDLLVMYQEDETDEESEKDESVEYVLLQEATVEAASDSRNICQTELEHSKSPLLKAFSTDEDSRHI